MSFLESLTNKELRIHGKAGKLVEKARASHSADTYLEASELLEKNASIISTMGIQFSELHDAIGFGLMGMGRADFAARNLDRALQLNPKNVSAMNNRAVLAMNLGDHQGALQRFDAALQVDPNSKAVHASRGTCLAAMGQKDFAISSFESAHRIDPNDLAIIEQLIGLAPGNASYWAAKGAALAKGNRHEDAILAFGKALAIKPDDASYHVGIGTAHAMMKRHADAVAAFEKALSIDRKSKDAWTWRGFSLESEGKWLDASDSYAEAARLDPRNLDIWMRMARTLIEAGKPERAVEACDAQARNARAMNRAQWVRLPE